MDILATLESLGFAVAIEDGNVRVRSERPEAMMTSELAENIRTHKAELIAQLRRQEEFAQILADALAKEAEIAKSYETRATLPGGVPPYQRVLQQQEWLSSIDWRYGLRCGISGQQCRVCKGMPCRDSTEWDQEAKCAP
jgi:hypothetical protein